MTTMWHGNTQQTSATAYAVLQRVTATVAVATGMAATGRNVDLAGLEQAAGLLCAQVLDLSLSEAAALRPALIALNESLAALTVAVRQAHP